jgi:L-asparaginase/Glu-tRNA(Gln) amidotransferase subunit D
MNRNTVERIDGQPANRFTRMGEPWPWWKKGSFLPHAYRPELWDNRDNHELPANQRIRFGISSPGTENPFDLRNLRVFDPEAVQDTLEQLVGNHRSGKKSFVMIGFGGTIGSTLTDNGAIPGVDVDEILKASGGKLDAKYTHAGLAFPTQIMSSQMRIDYAADAVIAMSWMYKSMPADVRDEFMGFMVTHGTDTMTPSATHMGMMLGPNVDFSVGVTGAQVSMDESEFSDGPQNIRGTLATMDLMHEESKHMVFLYMGGSAGGAMHPAGAVKISDRLIEGFESPAIPLVLDASDTTQHKTLVTPFFDEYSGERDQARDLFLPVIYRGYSPVRLIEANADIDPQQQYDELMTGRNRTLLLRTFGSFTMPDHQLDAILRAAREREEQSRPFEIYAANPFPTGRTLEHLDIESMRLREVVHAVDILPHAVGPKIKVARTLYGPDTDLRTSFLLHTNYIGERPQGWRKSEPLSEGVRRVGIATDAVLFNSPAVFPV